MLKACAARAASLVILAAACAGTVLADESTRTRVTIKGSGTSIAIERSEASVRRPPFAEERTNGLIDDAIRLKAGGVGDVSLLAYLRAHQAGLPAVVDAEDARRLRKAGAGKAVFAYLATVAAVEIGETGGGHEPEVPTEAAASYGFETPTYEAPYGYPFYGNAPSSAAGMRRGFHSRRMMVPRRPRVFPSPIGQRRMAGQRRPFAE